MQAGVTASPRDRVMARVAALNPAYLVAGLLSLVLLVKLSSPVKQTRVRGVDGPSSCPAPAGTHQPSVKRTYLPSAFEEGWYSNIRSLQDRACSIQGQEQYAQFQQMIDALEAQEVVATTGSSAAVDAYGRAFSPLDPLLSRMEYRDAKTGKLLYTSAMEPLGGILRDPRPPCWNPAWPGHLTSKTFSPHKEADKENLNIMLKYCLLDPAVGKHVAQEREWTGAGPKNILIDVGGSTWGDRFGLPWLLGAYGAFGVQFEHVYAWEAKSVTPIYWQGMPVDVKKRVHLYNMYASTACGSPDNPWTVLRAVAREEDFVAVKIDIDTPFVEMPLLRQLLADPTLAALVDELYFEHHVTLAPMLHWWGTDPDQTQGSLEDSYKLFRALREAGIRAHSWP